MLTGLVAVLWSDVGQADAKVELALKEKRSDEIVFESYRDVAEIHSIPLANGRKVADPESWRSILVAYVGVDPQSHLPITCTGTLIGPGVFLTAAHCFDRGASRGIESKISIGYGSHNELQVDCDIAPAYRLAVKKMVWNGAPPRVSDDFALCSFDSAKYTPPGIIYELIDTKNAVPKNLPVLMSGLGCAKLTVDRVVGLLSSASDLSLRIGDAIAQAPATLDAGAESNYLQIHSQISQPALCPGDSGGPLFSGIDSDHPIGKRRIRGINSTIGRAFTQGGDVYFVSKISVLASPSFIALLDEWHAAHKDNLICDDSSAGTHSCGN